MAGRIPPEFISELLARVDLAQVIGQHIQLKKAGREHKACCPFHQEKTPSFTVTTKGFYHCFGCGANGSAIGFLMEYTRCSFVDAVEDLARQVGMTVPRDARAQARQESQEPLYECMQQANRYYQEMLRKSDPAKEYARSRGLSGQICKEYQIGYAPAGYENVEKRLAGKFDRALLIKAGLLTKNDKRRVYDRFRNRLMFPIRDTRGRTVGFGGRVLEDQDTPKYINSPETPLFHKGRVLYGLYELQQRRGNLDQLVVTEGYMDVVSLAEAGVSNVVATLGTATTEDHLRQMGRFCRKFVFCFDGDDAGRAAGWRALEHILPVLRDGDEVRFAHLPEKEDPDSYIRNHGREVWQEFLSQSVLLEDYFFSQLTRDLDLEKLTDRSKLVQKARPLLSSMADSAFRDLMMNQLGELTDLTRNQLRISSKTTERQLAAQQGPKPSVGRPTRIRKMIRMLLEHPELAVQAQSSLLQSLDALKKPGMELFAEMVDLAQGVADVNTGGMIEAIRASRGEEDAQHLTRLLDWRPAGLDGVSAKGRLQNFEAGLRILQKERLVAWRSRLTKQQLGDDQTPGKPLSERQKKELQKVNEQLKELG